MDRQIERPLFQLGLDLREERIECFLTLSDPVARFFLAYEDATGSILGGVSHMNPDTCKIRNIHEYRQITFESC